MRSTSCASLLVLALLLPTPVPAQPASPDAGSDASSDAASDAGPAPLCPDPAVVRGAMEADATLRAGSDCLPEELARLTAAVRMFEACSGKVAPAPRWVFPVANVPPSLAIGGAGGSGFVRNRGIKCYVSDGAGHPAHDLFVHDRRQKSRDALGNPFPALAVEDGWVLVARDGWRPGDTTRSGNYVMVYLPGRKVITYYAHLDQVFVRPGERLTAGQVLGTIGRSGLNAAPRRSQTHLHFGLWDAATFRPFDSYPLLKAARTMEATAPTEPQPSAPR